VINNPHGLASITGTKTKEMFCVDEQQSILPGSRVKAQLREALSALERKIDPDLSIELCDVHQLDLLLESPTIIFDASTQIVKKRIAVQLLERSRIRNQVYLLFCVYSLLCDFFEQSMISGSNPEATFGFWTWMSVIQTLRLIRDLDRDFDFAKISRKPWPCK
jgi:hypothetical protein